MSLLDHTIWWHVYPLGALGVPRRADAADSQERAERFELRAWVDYAIELGCDGLLLGPIFSSVSHGYDTLDHYRIDPRIGTNEQFQELLDLCCDKGLSVILDGVFNHVARSHPLVAKRPEMVRWVDGYPRGWEGNLDLVELDHSSPAVRDLVTDVMLYWLRKGIAGWRLDVAYAVPTQFWRDVLGAVRREFPNAIFNGEVIHGDYARFVEESQVDTVTQYELWKAIWSSIRDENPWELAHAIERHSGFVERFIPQTFVGNHDVSRVASTVGRSGAALAAGVLLTTPGVPSIYYGDEQGFTGIKREMAAGDDEVRPPLPVAPSLLSPLGKELHRWYQQLIGFRRRHPWLVSGAIVVTNKAEGVLDYAVASSYGRIDVHLDYAARRIAIVASDEQLHFGGA